MNSSEQNDASSLGTKLLTIAYWLSVVIAGVAMFIVYDERHPSAFPLLRLSFPATVVGLAATFGGFVMLVWRHAGWSWRTKGLMALGHILVCFALITLWWWPTRGSLIGAIHRGDVKVVRTALICGVDPNSREYWGWHHGPSSFVLSTAALYGNLEIVRLLVEHGADVNRFDKDSSPPLIPAAAGGHRDVVEYLIEKGAPVNLVDPEHGTTAFSSAAVNGDFDLANRLLELGADPLLGNPRHAGSSGHIERLEYLRKLGVNLQSCLLAAAYAGKVEAVRYLLDLGYDPEFKTSTLYTVLDEFEHDLYQKEKSHGPSPSNTEGADSSVVLPGTEDETLDYLRPYHEIHDLLIQRSDARSGSQSDKK